MCPIDSMTTVCDSNTFLALVRQCQDEDERLETLLVSKVQLTGEDFFRLDVRDCCFEGCIFSGCTFERASFTGVTFRDCNLSGCHMEEAYISGCCFEGCKCTGLNLSGGVLKQTRFTATALNYAILDKCRLDYVSWKEVDFTEGTLSDAKLKAFQAMESRFVRCSFFKTELKGINFTTDDLVSPLVSYPPTELRGIKIDRMQAAELIGLWGILVE